MRKVLFVWLMILISGVVQAGFEGVTSLDWSPAGDLFLLAANGILYAGKVPTAAEARQLTPDKLWVDWARFGPDGKWFVYATRTEEGSVLWRGWLSDRDPEELFSFKGFISQPVVSSKGDAVVYIGEEDGETDLFLVDLEAGKTRKLTDTPFLEACPDLSPDGRLVVFSGLWGSDGESWNLFLLDLESGSIQQLTDDSFFDWCPRFSPDGGWLAFERGSGGRSDIYLIRSDGTDVSPFTYDEWREAFPVWSPDGERIAYAQRKPSGWVIVTEGAY
jgi:TolB protein